MSINPLAGSSLDSGDEPMQRAPGSTTNFSPLFAVFGIAVLGILMVSIWELGGFTPNQHIYYQRGPHGGNYILLTTVSALFDGKMLALLALAFGAGIVRFLTREHPENIPAADAYIRRQLWLLLFGIIVAFLLLFPSEVFYPFAVVGILLFGLWRFSPRGLLLSSFVFLLIFFGKQFWNYQDDKKDYKKYVAVTAVEKRIKQDSTTRAKKDSMLRAKDSVLLKNEIAKNKIADSVARKRDTLTKKQAEEKGKWEGIVKATKYDSSKTAALNKAMRDGSYTKVWNRVMKESQAKESFWLYRIGLWEIGSMMLLGMALMKWGFFQFAFPPAKYLLIAAVCLLAGIGFAWYRLHYNNVRLGDYEGFIKAHNTPYNLFVPAENMLMALGYGALVMALMRVAVLNWFWRVMAKTGSMAFSNYFIQCLACTLFFYGYGLGYFGKLEQWELYFMVLELSMLQVIFSVLWLRYFQLGPVEWLWSCLIYCKWVPIKKRIAYDSALALNNF